MVVVVVVISMMMQMGMVVMMYSAGLWRMMLYNVLHDGQCRTMMDDSNQKRELC